MKKKLKLGCVLMAAGNATRFGENKLLAEFMGRPLIEYALRAIPKDAFKRVAVVSQYGPVLDLAGKYGFISVENQDPAAGVSHTIRLGLDALQEMDAAMFMVADQPCLRPETVQAQIDFFRTKPNCIVAMGYGKRRGNPVIFPSYFFPQLRALSGDRGGSHVMSANPDALLLYQVEEDLQLRDVDRKQELEQLKSELTRPF